MDEQDASAAYIAQMYELLLATRHHLDTLGGSTSLEQRQLAVQELAQLGTTIASLSARLHAEDCTQAAEAFAACFDLRNGATVSSPTLLANCADLLTYLQERLEVMIQHQHVLGPTDNDRLTVSRLILTVQQTHEQSGRVESSGASSFGLHEGAQTGSQLTAEERALLRSFQTTAVRQGMRHVSPDSGGAPSIQPAAQPGASPEAASIMARAASTVTAEELDHIPAEMKRYFVVETREDIQDLRRMVLSFEQPPGERSALSEMGRLVHKIKGAASTLGFDVLASLALIFEDVIRALQSPTVDAVPDAVGTLTALLALFEAALEATARQTSDSVLVDLIDRAETARDGLLSRLSVGPAGLRGRLSETPPDSADTLGPVAAGAASAQGDSGEPHPRANEIEPLLRVEVGRLDKLMTRVNALVLNRASFMQMRDDILKLQVELDQALGRLTTISQRVTDRPSHDVSHVSMPLPGSSSNSHKAPLSVPLSPISPISDQAWDELQLERLTELDQALRQLSEVVADTTSASKYLRFALTRLDQIGDEQATITHDIQRDVIQIRLVRLEDLMPRMQLEARRLANSLGKVIAFTVRGQMTEIDRNISEALAEPLIQLVRNAVVHGIESREERVEQGKLETGSIWIHAYYVGSEVVIEVGDDGRGVNPYRLAASAVAMGILNAESARTMAFSEALDMMFLPGITTFQEAQIVAGRGIGLDEVRTAIGRLKGTIQVRSEVGKGSVFRIRVPISLSIVRSLSVQVAGQPFAVPFSSVLQMASVAESDLLPVRGTELDMASGSSARGSQRLRVRVAPAAPNLGEILSQDTAGNYPPAEDVYEEIPALRLADLLGFEAPVPSTQLALIVEAGRRRAALLVDQVAGDDEAVVQTLPSHLRRRSIRGATVTPDGVVQLLIDLPELLQGALDSGEKLPPPRKKRSPQSPASEAPKVLIVDDSMSIRGALELALSRAGFDVTLARDGIEAFEMMLASVPRVMVLDIEMPRLDGFELLSVMRDTPQFAEVRVVMLTSRAAEKHREQAMKLGASAYLIKPCPQETLIETVRAQLSLEASTNFNHG
ncbi:MAG: response regulator [Ktedonobacterales bacterium]